MTSIRLAPLARADLKSIWAYTAKRWTIAQADIYIRSIDGVIMDIASGSKSVRIRDDIKAGLMSAQAGAHMIILRRDDQGLVVLRILHERMDFGRHLI